MIPELYTICSSLQHNKVTCSHFTTSSAITRGKRERRRIKFTFKRFYLQDNNQSNIVFLRRVASRAFIRARQPLCQSVDETRRVVVTRRTRRFHRVGPREKKLLTSSLRKEERCNPSSRFMRACVRRLDATSFYQWRRNSREFAWLLPVFHPSFVSRTEVIDVEGVSRHEPNTRYLLVITLFDKCWVNIGHGYNFQLFLSSSCCAKSLSNLLLIDNEEKRKPLRETAV